MKLNHYDHAEIMERIQLYTTKRDHIALERLKENNPKLADDIQVYYNKCCSDKAQEVGNRAGAIVTITFVICFLLLLLSMWVTK